MTSKLNQSTRVGLVGGTDQPERGTAWPQSVLKVPELPLAGLECPTRYLKLAEKIVDKHSSYSSEINTDGKKIEMLRKEISADAKWAAQLSIEQLGMISENERAKALRVLNNYGQQWKLVGRVVYWACQLLKSITESQGDTYRHDVGMTKSYIALLIATLSSDKFLPGKPDLEAEFTQILSHSSKLSDATTVYGRKAHNQAKWRNAVLKRQGIHKNAPKIVHLPPPSTGGLSQGLAAMKNAIEATTKELDTKIVENREGKKPEGKETGKKNGKKPDGKKDGKKGDQEEQQVKLAWCPVLHAFIPEDKGIAAHIFPHAIGYELAKTIINDRENGRDIVFDPRNGLWMAKAVEQAFDNAQVIIVPTDTENPDFENESYDLKLVVLNKELLEPKRSMILSFKHPDGTDRIFRWTDVNERTLDFQGVDARPAKRFFFFNYLYTINRITEQKPKAHESRLETLRDMGRSWATPGSYLEQGLLNRLKKGVDQRLPPITPDLEAIAPDVGTEYARAFLEHSGDILDLPPERSESGYGSEDSDEKPTYEFCEEDNLGAGAYYWEEDEELNTEMSTSKSCPLALRPWPQLRRVFPNKAFTPDKIQ